MIIPVVAKVFKRIVYDQLYRYLNENKLLCCYPSGFSTLHATVTAVIKATDVWSLNVERSFCRCIFHLRLYRSFRYTMLFFFQNFFKDLQAYSIRDSENLAAHPRKEFSGVPSPPWPFWTFTHNDIYILKALVEVLPSILGFCVPHNVLNPDPI